MALTAEQVETYALPVISKPDRRYSPPRSFDAVETEALGQARIVAALTVSKPTTPASATSTSTVKPAAGHWKKD